ncbi:MAG: glycosyltransferase family 2 protein [Alphaproteobacteria bacterium]|nr:glycosyltransferase family 2 protein [Alphaproteobacteria bacterium]
MLYVIVPVHNRLDSTKSFLYSLKEQVYNEIQIVIVDDGSSDHTSEYLSENHPEITVLHGDGSLFWGGAINMGLDHVKTVATPDDFIAFANNDITFEANTIVNILKVISEHGSLALFHALVKEINGICFTSGSKALSWPLFWTSHPFRGCKNDDCRKQPLAKVDFANGRFLVFKPDILNVIPEIDTIHFKHYLGDCDFSMRLKKKGIYTYIVPSSVVTIDQSTTGMNAGNLSGKLQFFKSLTSVRSSNNLPLRYKFGIIHCPVLYFPFYCIAVTLQVFIKNLIIRDSKN